MSTTQDREDHRRGGAKRGPTRRPDGRDVARSATGHFSSRLNAADTLLWNIERDPYLRSTIVSISLLDRSPDWRRLTDRMAAACESLPRLRERVVAGPLHRGPLRWQTDEFFDLGYHLRRVVAPAPGSRRALLDIAGLIAMSVFDKDRPLWEFTIVEGLADGQAAIVQKVHHSLTDGVGAIELARLFMDDRRNSNRPAATPTPPIHRRPGALRSVADSFASDVRALIDLSGRRARAFPGVMLRSAANPVGLALTAAHTAASIGRMLSPVTEPLSPLMTGRGLSRRLDAFEVPLAALKGAAHRAGSTLNDAFLASVAGGVALYHDAHGAPVNALRVTMPISTRRPGDPSGSNRFAPARFVIPMTVADPVERMRVMGQLATKWRHEPALPLADTISAALNFLPVTATVAIFGAMLKAIDFVATDIPGRSKRTYIAGAEVTRQYAFGPPSGAAFSVALLSHVDLCCIGITTDTAAVPDPEVLTACLREGFDTVVSSRGDPQWT
jgi:diacylglycerol O-acyltransferase / wax synthase